jgi:hypothetical protein
MPVVRRSNHKEPPTAATAPLYHRSSNQQQQPTAATATEGARVQVEVAMALVGHSTNTNNCSWRRLGCTEAAAVTTINQPTNDNNNNKVQVKADMAPVCNSNKKARRRNRRRRRNNNVQEAAAMMVACWHSNNNEDDDDSALVGCCFPARPRIVRDASCVCVEQLNILAIG